MKGMFIYSYSKSEMTGNGSKYAQAPFTFPAAQEEALSLCNGVS